MMLGYLIFIGDQEKKKNKEINPPERLLVTQRLTAFGKKAGK